MKVLVTGGTGVIGVAAVTHLLGRGHSVRLFSRHADHDRAQFAGDVEAYGGSVDDPGSTRGAADGCDAILHIAGVVAESPPQVTFERVNVEGTRYMLQEAERAHVRRFVFVSSLGAERGESPYHRSKHRAEELVRRWSGNWVICRPGNVYGPGDEVISLLLKMVRTLPAVPVIGGGDQPFQPLWAGDIGAALATVVERNGLVTETLELAGPEVTSINDLLDRLERITGRSPARIPVPSWLASTGAKLADTIGVELPVHEGQITMLLEENMISPGRRNALTEVLGIRPTPLDEGLAMLADALPEQLPEEGVGPLMRRRYWADIVGSGKTPAAVLAMFREEFASLLPESKVELPAEPGTPAMLSEGATMTMRLPLRGTIQVRVVELTEREVTCVTVEGHPLAGAVRFLAEQRGDAVRFEVQTYDRAATTADRIALATIATSLKHSTWQTTVERVVERSGGTAPDGVEMEEEKLDDAQAAEIERWVEGLVMATKREG